MHLQKISLQNFRNYSKAEWIPSRSFNYLFGPNGAGKTNLLEAVYFLIHLQSFRRVQRAGMIGRGADGMYLMGAFGNAEGTQLVRLEAAVSGEARKYKVNGKEEQDLVSYLGQVHAVVFFPESLRFVKEGPFLRRVAFDRAIAAENAPHLPEAREYSRLLRERNRLLKRGGDSGMIDVWERRLLRVASRIVVRRYLYLKSLRQLMPALCRRMGIDPSLEIVYRFIGKSDSRSWDSLLEKTGSGQEEKALESETEGILQEMARDVAGREREQGRTLWGPHLDDFEIFWDGRKAKESASQGEQRLLTIILAICGAESYKQKKNDDPIVLLDDLSSELDQSKRMAVLKYLETMGAQVFITSTERPAVVKNLEDSRIFAIEKGKITAP